MKIVKIGTVTFRIKGTDITTVFGQFKLQCREGNRHSNPRNPYYESFVLGITYSVTKMVCMSVGIVHLPTTSHRVCFVCCVLMYNERGMH
jgi:hypothetical protein